ncbi:MAG: aconitate hydratase AcnA [Candidatus Sumerlaea chitinivorans]|nr:aconitate hydratase AcnA [Candidatus Sumerlaea chitinivorans]
MTSHPVDSYSTCTTLKCGNQSYEIFSLARLSGKDAERVSRLPISLRVLLENLLRHDDGSELVGKSIRALIEWNPQAEPDTEIGFTVGRVLLQDFTGVPCVADLAAMRDAVAKVGGDPTVVNPLQPVDLVIDHSVQVDVFGRPDAAALNSKLEYERNRERYVFLRWGANAFRNFRVVPPDTGIVHQVNIEFLAPVVATQVVNGRLRAFFDTLVGTDSHTPMVNALGVLGWGVGGIEAEAAMLGQPISMLIPQVVGVHLKGRLPAGATATDLVLTITQRLRQHGVVGKFVEYFGDGLDSLSVADRATVANMSPEYGATVGFFPVDEQTLEYLRFTGRSEEQIALVEAYWKEQGMFRTRGAAPLQYSAVIEIDLGAIEPCIAGPRRPHDRVPLANAKTSWRKALGEYLVSKGQVTAEDAAAFEKGAVAPDSVFARKVSVECDGNSFEMGHGRVVISAITSCTNTSNPSVLVAAGLLARKARERGLHTKPWVKTSLAPGSQAVTEYLRESGLLRSLEELGFHVVGYGCTTCIGNSGPLPQPVSEAIQRGDLVAAAVLSGNRNFEGRIHAQVRANYLASPPLVVSYALAGTVDIDFQNEPIGVGSDGQPVYLRDLWPTPEEVIATVQASVHSEMFRRIYSNVFEGDENWRAIEAPQGLRYAWDESSTYIKRPPFFDEVALEPTPPSDIVGARALAVLGHSVTTDHISPAGSIAKQSPAAQYLMSLGVEPKDFNSYGARRGNHEVMVRGTFANIRLRNELVPGVEGGFTVHLPDGEQMTIYDAAMRYKAEGVPLIVIAGQEYGSGSSRDWAAKGTALLGVRAVIAESFERIHRSNLVGMGILPLQFEPGQSRHTLGLTGRETYDILGIADALAPGCKLRVLAHGEAGQTVEFWVRARIDTPNELAYYRNGGILPYVFRQLVRAKA